MPSDGTIHRVTTASITNFPVFAILLNTCSGLAHTCLPCATVKMWPVPPATAVKHANAQMKTMQCAVVREVILRIGARQIASYLSIPIVANVVIFTAKHVNIMKKRAKQMLLSLRSEDPFMALTWSGRLNIKAMRSATAKFVIKSLSGDKPPQPCFKLKPRRIKFAVTPKKHANPKTTFCPINPSHSELVNSVISMQMLRSLLSGSSRS